RPEQPGVSSGPPSAETTTTSGTSAPRGSSAAQARQPTKALKSATGSRRMEDPRWVQGEPLSNLSAGGVMPHQPNFPAERDRAWQGFRATGEGGRTGGPGQRPDRSVRPTKLWAGHSCPASNVPSTSTPA